MLKRHAHVGKQVKSKRKEEGQEVTELQIYIKYQFQTARGKSPLFKGTEGTQTCKPSTLKLATKSRDMHKCATTRSIRSETSKKKQTQKKLQLANLREDNDKSEKEIAPDSFSLGLQEYFNIILSFYNHILKINIYSPPHFFRQMKILRVH
ncbi:Hypothetical_protein [Hexamita inflata]|uniref:Hypothetical_protein n=1 Tax=Hexamita inflata TaxID=28002 RepID=A0AA86P6M0_9EUKA|nr:Hypothetical protein HINF_LOCUS19089 [Hexamita inflata]